MEAKVKQFMDEVIAANPGEKEFHQAVQEVAEKLIPFIEENPKYKHAKVLERLVEPERVIMFRVPWIDDEGNVQVNKGYRIEFNSAIGPYKGGLRFHPSVTLSILKFLGFEQIFQKQSYNTSYGRWKRWFEFQP
jgi:glutamate dehydrogenase (NADP+)